jgi:hypothetical protein
MTRDVWADELFECSWGGLRIDVQTTQDVSGRTLVPFESPGRDGAELRDMGGEPRVTRCRVLFVTTRADDDPMARFRAFAELVRDGATRTFVHPLTGAYEAKVGEFNFNAEADARGLVVVDCTFHEDAERPSVFEPGPGAQPQGGLEDVKASAAAVDDGLLEVFEVTGDELTTTVGADAIALAESWEESGDELTRRDVTQALASFTNKLESEMDRLEVATDIDRWPLVEAFSRLNYSVRKAADTVITDTPQIIEWRPIAPVSLFAFCQRTYGADQAEERADQIERLNDIKNPARIEPGAVYRVPAPSSSPRLRSPV